jgi:hypothetical protein
MRKTTPKNVALLILFSTIAFYGCCTKKDCPIDCPDSFFYLEFPLSKVDQPDSIQIISYANNGQSVIDTFTVSGHPFLTTTSVNYLITLPEYDIETYAYRIISGKYSLDSYISDFELSQYSVKEKNCNTCFPAKNMLEYECTKIENFKVNLSPFSGNTYTAL